MPPRPVTLAALTLVLGLSTVACRPAGPTQPPRPSPSAPEVIEWFLGEQVRRSPPPSRGISLGLLTADLGAPPGTPRRPRPGSCAPGLSSFIPTPDHSGEWFGVDETGRLLRYAGAGWSPVRSKVEVPPIRRLLAFGKRSSPLELLVTTKQGEREHLTMLTIAGAEITLLRSPDPAMLTDHRAALLRFDSGRCVDDHHCLHLVSMGNELLLMLEPTLYSNWTELASLHRDGVRDVRYADPEGKTVDLLSAEACEAPAQPSAQPEASP